MRRLRLPLLVAAVGTLLLADFLVVNPSLSALAQLVLDLVVLVAAGAALAGVVALAARHAGGLWRRRADPLAAGMVLAGMAAMLVAGLRPGSTGAHDPLTRWLVAALLIPLGASLFALLFVSTLGALRRSFAIRAREATVLATAASVTLVASLPLGGAPGAWLAGTAGWALDVPIGAVFRGLLIGVAVATAVTAARALLGIGPGDE